MDAKQEILTRLLPKTNQTIVYRTGDDGTFQKGWWKGRTVVNNKTRFIAKTISGDDVVIDRATGLMWAANGNGVGCNGGDSIDWFESIDYANTLSFAGFSDWRIPNIFELFSIADLTRMNPAIDITFFPNTNPNYYWSANTHTIDSGWAWVVEYNDGVVKSEDKDSDRWLRCVRSI